MYKVIVTFIVSFIFIGCSNFQITGVMCDKLKADPNETIPTECRKYSEAEAEKASRVDKEILSPDDAIKFTK